MLGRTLLVVRHSTPATFITHHCAFIISYVESSRTIRAEQRVLRLRPRQREGAAHPQLPFRRGRGGRLRLAARAAPRGFPRHAQRRHRPRAARPPPELDGRVPPHAHEPPPTTH